MESSKSSSPPSLEYLYYSSLVTQIYEDKEFIKEKIKKDNKIKGDELRKRFEKMNQPSDLPSKIINFFRYKKRPDG